MTSRFMLQVQQRNRAAMKREGNRSLTEREIKFYRPKMNESMEAHINRMMEEAAEETKFPTEWWRHLARVLQIYDEIDMSEFTVIMDHCKHGFAVEITLEWMRNHRKRKSIERLKQINHVIKMDIGKEEEEEPKKRKTVKAGKSNRTKYEGGFKLGKF